MTTPSERARSLRFAGETLSEIAANLELPDDLRHQARVVMRHYPSTEEIAAISKVEARRAELTRHPLMPAWLAPEDGIKSTDAPAHISSVPTLSMASAHDAVLELLRRVRLAARIGLAEGASAQEKEQVLREIEIMTRLLLSESASS